MKQSFRDTIHQLRGPLTMALNTVKNFVAICFNTKKIEYRLKARYLFSQFFIYEHFYTSQWKCRK